uniref:(Fe-S)-binding protein n=1 Tax=candidate division WOR-3 bacterium TaxID=2052148 RepID=A0A7C4CBV4_UNCW3
MNTDATHLLGCIQCGRCSGGCPVSVKSELNVRKLVYNCLDASTTPLRPDEYGIWECTTCATCNLRCPKNVRPADLVVQLRCQQIESGRVSTNIQQALESTYLQGNPWTRARERRMDWATGLDIPKLAPNERTDVLLFVCCTSAYDARCQQVARSLVTLLRKSGIEFAIIGEQESCCCSEQKWMGEQGMFEEIAHANFELFRERRMERIVTISPHCYNAFVNDYPALNVPILHYTQLLTELLSRGRLAGLKPLQETVTYHDPCYLGKRNSIYEPPRELLRALAGDRFVELDRSRETSLCCEGGGGRMWFESDTKGRLAETRIQDAIDKSAAIIASACPFCLLTLEDATKTTNSEERIRVRDIAELLAEAI